MTIKLSSDQQRAMAKISAWISSPTKTITLAGLAGTGKTTLIKEVVRKVRGKASVCAFTGKAAHVLTQKGVKASTMHSLIYTPAVICGKCGSPCTQDEAATKCFCSSPDPRDGFAKRPILPHPLVIVDEASMVNRILLQDLESFDVKILYVGDHGQLEPVGDDPGLMANPDIKLEKIHRQAAGSPIIQFAHHVRVGKAPRTFGADAVVTRRIPSDFHLFDAILCAYNKTRVLANERVRQRLGFDTALPQPGERLICLRNNRDIGVFNGQLANLEKVSQRGGQLQLDVTDDTGQRISDIPALAAQFGAEKTLRDIPPDISLWDFGYAMTVHKSQGSEWDRVLVLEQISRLWSAPRWRYTAATRAAKHLTYCTK